jgi:hypothetical protein
MDRTLFPLMALIHTHVVPCLETPAQVARQLPPWTVVATETFVPVLIITRTGAVVEVLVRRFALHRATFADVAPRTSPGIDTELTTKKNRAATTADAKRVVREARAAGRRGACDMTEPRLAGA